MNNVVVRRQDTESAVAVLHGRDGVGKRREVVNVQRKRSDGVREHTRLCSRLLVRDVEVVKHLGIALCEPRWEDG